MAPCCSASRTTYAEALGKAPAHSPTRRGSWRTTFGSCYKLLIGFALVWFGSVGFGLIGSLVGCLLCIGWDDQGFTCKSMCPTVHNQARSIGTGRYDNLFPLLVKLLQHQSHPMKLEPLAVPAMAKTMTLFSFQDSHDAIPFVLLGDLANGGFSK